VQAKDPKGNITIKVFDKAGRIKYVYDASLTSTSKTEYNYYDNGNRQNVIYPNGYKEAYTYYKNNLLWTLINYKKSGSTDIVMDSYTYTYDKSHNQSSKVEVINSKNKGKTSYTYDVLNRLKTVVEPNGRTTAYRYDKAGNRINETVNFNGLTTTTTYYYSKDNRLMSLSKKEGDKFVENEIYGYDYNGNMTYKSKNTTQSYDVSEGESIGLYVENMGNSEVTVNSYDGFNQLTKTQIGNMNITYAYNGEGRRVEKTVNSSTTRYLYEFDKVVLEIDGTGKETGRNVYGTNLLMRKSGSDKLYYMYNGHADVTALIDASTGVVRGSYYYDAFGNILEQKYYTTSGVETTEKINNSITYAGYQYDEETGLYYLNARMYDPKVARFLQEDTYRGSSNDPLSLNLYTYCLNNPIIYWDPTGHWAEGDSNRPVAVQMALLQLSDDWLNAKRANDKTGMDKAASTAIEVRRDGTNHPMVKKITRQFVPIERTDLSADDAERVFVDNWREVGQNILSSLNVVDKAKEKKHLKMV